MKLSKTKKFILLGASIGILTTMIVTPIVLLNNNENNQDKQNQKDVENVVKILEEKNEEKKIITLPVNTQGKIIANNQEKIIEKIKTLIGKENLNGVKIKVLMQDDSNISTNAQKIIIKLTKNEFSKKIEGFLVKKQSIMDVDKDIEAIKNILDAKSGNDLIITLPSDSTGNIIGNRINKIAIIKKIIMLIDPSNKSGEGNHQSLRGTSIQVSMNVDTPISTTPQDIIVSISKTSGETLTTNKIFQVKRDFTPDEDIMAIREILVTKNRNNDPNLLITLSSSFSGSITNNPTIKKAIERKARIAIDPSNVNGNPNHESLRGTTITFTRMTFVGNDLISTSFRPFVITISKAGGKSLEFINFLVRKARN